MGAGHGAATGLYLHGHSRIHALAPEAKVAGTFLFVLAVVATPREAVWAYALYAAVVLALVRTAGISPGALAKRLVIEAPFLAFAVFLPFVGEGERVDVLGLSLSENGLWGAWNILVKGTLGVAATVVLASTTPVQDILRGLESLRVPRIVTAIAGFMVRYLDVILGEMRRMRVARESRGYSAGWIWQARAVAQSAGALFIRSYERGERVYLAMTSRGYAGVLPDLRRTDPATGREWATALSPAALTSVVALLAWTVAR